MHSAVVWFWQLNAAFLIQLADEHIQASPFPSRHHQLCSLAYYRFNLSYRDVEDSLTERSITVSREAIRHWYPKNSLRSWGRLCINFGKIYTCRLKKSHRSFGDTFFVDDIFFKINANNITCGERLTKRACPVSAASALGMATL
jgi:transposase-like protein